MKFKLGCKQAKTIDNQPSMMRMRCVSDTAPASMIRHHVNPAPLMLMNDTTSNCTSAGMGNYIRAVSSIGGNMIAVTDEDALTFYEEVTGYDPERPETDTGAYESEVLSHAMLHGFPTQAGNFYPLWGTCDIQDRNAVANVICRFGATYLGVMLSSSDMAQVSAQGINTVLTRNNTQYGDATPGSAGGHCLLGWEYTGLQSDDTVTLLTWGMKIRCTWDWLESRGMEAHGMLFPQLIKANGFYPTGQDLDILREMNRGFLKNA